MFVDVRSLVAFSTRRLLPALLLASAAAALVGCQDCSDPIDTDERVYLPPPRCNGALVTTSASCPSGTKVEEWVRPDGTVTGYYDARSAWLAAPCADACRTVKLDAVACRVDDRSTTKGLVCTVRHDEACSIPAPGYQAARPRVGAGPG